MRRNYLRYAENWHESSFSFSRCPYVCQPQYPILSTTANAFQHSILGIAYHATNITSHHLSFQATLVDIVNRLLISSKLYSHEQVRSLCSSVCSSLICSTEKYIAHFFRIASFHRNSRECSRGENQYWRNANIKIACTSYLRQEKRRQLFFSHQTCDTYNRLTNLPYTPSADNWSWTECFTLTSRWIAGAAVPVTHLVSPWECGVLIKPRHQRPLQHRRLCQPPDKKGLTTPFSHHQIPHPTQGKFSI